MTKPPFSARLQSWTRFFGLMALHLPIVWHVYGHRKLRTLDDVKSWVDWVVEPEQRYVDDRA